MMYSFIEKRLLVIKRCPIHKGKKTHWSPNHTIECDETK